MKKKLPKSKRNESAKKRLLTVNKINSEKLTRKGTTNSYKGEVHSKPKGSSLLFPPINKPVKAKSTGGSKKRFDSNFATDVKRTMNREFIFKQQKATYRPEVKHRRLTELVSGWNEKEIKGSMARKSEIKRMSDPLELINSGY